jgi:hypothetical protein
MRNSYLVYLKIMISNLFAYFDGISQVGGKIGAMASGQSSNHLSARELEGERWFAEKVLIYHSELGSLMLH